MLAEECRKELTDHLIPFWSALRDKQNGGFYGYMSYDLQVNRQADKGVILHSRILWFFASCYAVLGDKACLENAAAAFEFLKNHCIDKEYGGVYWMVNYKGEPVDSMKHTYNIAFAIYALSAYYNACGEPEALALAEKLFADVEAKTPDEYGYGESFSRDWKPVANDALSENGIMAEKTMNAVLHLIEAYTELYKANHSQKVSARLEFLLRQVRESIYDATNQALRVFFDQRFQVLGDIHSFGHDIEAAWLMDLACETLENPVLTEEFRRMDLDIANNIKRIAFENGTLKNERDGKKVDASRIWWVQAETVVGFVNAYQKSGDTAFLTAAYEQWDYIKAHIIDQRVGGEWFYRLEPDGTPDPTQEIAGPWKCPYHNGRMCLEMIKRHVN